MARFVTVGSLVINPEHVEGITLSSDGESVWIHMVSGKKNQGPTNLSVYQVVELLEGK